VSQRTDFTRAFFKAELEGAFVNIFPGCGLGKAELFAGHLEVQLDFLSAHSDLFQDLLSVAVNFLPAAENGLSQVGNRFILPQLYSHEIPANGRPIFQEIGQALKSRSQSRL
jgi:hypothetical protein